MVSVYGAHLLLQAAEEDPVPTAFAAPLDFRSPMSPPDDPLSEEKRRLRATARSTRDALPAAERAAADARIAERLLSGPFIRPGDCVSAFWPMGSEVDLRPAMARLHERGHRVALPVVVAAGRPLLFRAWHPAAVLQPAGFGTQIPPADAPELDPQVLLVPLLAFDRAGYRLGYGGGFYDRTLVRLRAAGPCTAIGVAYAAQEVAEVPRDATDARLDAIVTELEMVDLRASETKVVSS